MVAPCLCKLKRSMHSDIVCIPPSSIKWALTIVGLCHVNICCMFLHCYQEYKSMLCFVSGSIYCFAMSWIFRFSLCAATMWGLRKWISRGRWREKSLDVSVTLCGSPEKGWRELPVLTHLLNGTNLRSAWSVKLWHNQAGTPRATGYWIVQWKQAASLLGTCGDIQVGVSALQQPVPE